MILISQTIFAMISRFEEPVTREFDSDDEDLSTSKEKFEKKNTRLHFLLIRK